MRARHRSFNAVFYPESAPEDFRDRISEWHVPALLILHDQEEEKKPHYHLLLMFSGKKSLGQVHELVDSLGSERVQPVHDTRAFARYLVHLDHPEKVQYPLTAIEAFSGACVADLTAPTVDPLPEVLEYVRSEGLDSYSRLVDYCQIHRVEWLRSVTGHTHFWVGYLKSVEYDRSRARMRMAGVCRRSHEAAVHTEEEGQEG